MFGAATRWIVDTGGDARAPVPGQRLIAFLIRELPLKREGTRGWSDSLLRASDDAPAR